MRAAPSPEEVRRQNLGALLRYVHRHGATSRAELTTRLGLNRSTIGALTADLAAASLVVEEAGRGESGRAGRPSLVVSPRSDAVCVYAVSIEVDQVRAARVGLGGVVLDRRDVARAPAGGAGDHDASIHDASIHDASIHDASIHDASIHDASDHDAGDRDGRDHDGSKQLAATVTELHAATPAGTQVMGTGIAVSGRVRRADGTVALAPDPEPVTGLPDVGPVAVGAAADLAVLAEHSRGVAAGCDTVIYLSGDAGIAAGIIAGGRRVSGYGGGAGEVGHMVVRPDGLLCGCGSRGCWETEVGELALLRIAGRIPGPAAAGARGREAVRAVVEAAARGDIMAREAVRHVGDWLGLGVGNLVNIFNPEMVVFGETLRDIYLVAAAQLRSRLNSVALAGSLAHLRLRTPALGDDAPLIGAAELAFESLLADPLGRPA